MSEPRDVSEYEGVMLEDVLEKLDEVQEAIEVLRENQEETLEKLDNLSTPGVDYSIREEL